MKSIRVIALLMLLLCLLAQAGRHTRARADTIIRLTFAGDVTLGSEEKVRPMDYSLDSFAASHGYDYFFARVKDLFSRDDLTIVNLEGVLSDSSEGENTNKTYRFRGPTDFAQILTSGSVEMVNLANNHTLDYGERGLEDTKSALARVGVAHFGGMDVRIYEKEGVKLAFFGLSYSQMKKKDRQWAAQEIQRLKREEGVSAAIFTFHAGREYSEARTAQQQEYAREIIAAGADLVVMHHPHVVQGMSIFDNRSVLYSLGNFCFGGNKNVRAMEALVAVAELTFSDDGQYLGQQITLCPAHISGTEPRSNYQPHLVTGKDAKRVMRLVQADTRFKLNPVDEETGIAVQDFLPADE
ncbi:MAG: CapA family protein [Clostridia bacterium]|nr:CapA family protein [Clostridia bacterium]